MRSIEEIERVFLDTAPLVYFVEKNEKYRDAVRLVFDRIDTGLLWAVTSPVTLAECLVLPYRNKRPELTQYFLERIVNANNTTFVPLNQEIACQAAELRARYNLTLDDAFQVATCLYSTCDGFLTNDKDLKRGTEVEIIVLDELIR